MKSALKILAVIAIVFVAFGIWYKQAFTMKVAEAYEVNEPVGFNRIFIATQGSTFKDHLVQDITNDLRPGQVYMKVADVSELENVNAADWNAVVILHTWEMQRAPKAVKDFMSVNKDANNLVIFSTSASGKDGMEGVDGVTGASVISEIEVNKNYILEKIDPFLKKDSICC